MRKLTLDSRTLMVCNPAVPAAVLAVASVEHETSLQPTLTEVLSYSIRG